MINDEAAKVVTSTPWADQGDRSNPEDVGLNRLDGWTLGYEQRGSGLEPERPVF